MRCVILACWILMSSLAAGENIRVVDESGKPVKGFEAMYHTADQGYGLWEPGYDGRWNLEPTRGRRADVIDLLVRADGYVTAIRRFDRAAIDALDDETTTITLVRGRKMTLRFELPDGMQLPEDFLPEVYPVDLAWRVRMMWQPSNQRVATSDFNFLNVTKNADGTFSFRLPAEPLEFFVAIQQPGWLRFFEAGPFTGAELEGDVLAVTVPRPAGIDVRFDAANRDPDELPFDKSYCEVLWPNRDQEGSYYSVTDSGAEFKDGAFRLTDLAPAVYRVDVRTQAKDVSPDADPRNVNPGRFFAMANVMARAGETVEQTFAYVPFDPDAWKGEGWVRIKFLLANGAPAAGKQASIDWFDGRYGNLNVFAGPARDDGIVEVDGVSTAVTYADSPYGPFSVSLEGDPLGFFRLKPTDEVQEFEFRMPPKVGDDAPSFPLVHLQSGEAITLADFRDKIVLVEFWATWCGPCQPAMSKLKETAEAHAEKWDESVAIVPVSTDKTMELAAEHLAARGWDTVPQYWASRSGDEYFTPAETAYAVHGIPHAVLIDRSGKVAWVGHPMDDREGKDLTARIETLRAQ